MHRYSLSHVIDCVLLRDLGVLVARDRTTTAALLAHIAEVDARKLYLPAAHPSMFSYCVRELRLSEDAAAKRIQAARTARQFPAIFDALADGRLHLSAVVLLAPYVTPETADELLAAASNQSKSEIEQLLAQRFPRPDVAVRVQALLSPSTTLPLAPLTPGPVEQHAPGHVEVSAPRPRVTPLSPLRFALQLTIGESTHDKLRYAQELLSHQIPLGDVAQVLDRALDALIHQLEKRKFAATARPHRGPRRATAGGRYIPAHVKRAVWERDGGRCSFVSESGHRCPARRFLEFDHIDEVARGGQATVERMRLRCRAHNQYGAECTFGAAFMRHQRQQAQRAAAQARERATAAEPASEREVVPWLQRLGFRADEVRRAAAYCATLPDAPLEDRVRAALSFLRPGHRGAPRLAGVGCVRDSL